MDRRILVVEDSELYRQQLRQLLAGPDRDVVIVEDATAALELLVEKSFSLVVTDLDLPGIGGLDLIREIRSRDLPASVIVVGHEPSVESTVEAIQLGAVDFVLKPIDRELFRHQVEKALKDRTLTDEIAALKHKLRRRHAYHDMLGRSRRMAEVFARVERVSSSSCTVLITGETGTGKELIAAAIHQSDATRKPGGKLVVVNCAALPEHLLESELFGHERGAFTGADRLHVGRFETAAGGTLFLDEIGDMPMGMQAKLLRVLQDGRFERVGGLEPIQSSCRVLAATNVDLAEAVDAGRFRRDLYYRLNVVSIEAPPLRDRLDDVPLLVHHFLHKMEERGLPARTMARSALSRLVRYDWPGNVRELEHAVELMVLTASGPIIEPDDLPPEIVPRRDEPFSLEFDHERPLLELTDELTRRVEKAYLVRVLEKYRGRIDQSAAHCGLSRRSISEKLRRYQIDKADFKPVNRRARKASHAEPVGVA